MIGRWLWLDHVPPGLKLTAEERQQVLALARHERKTRPYRRPVDLTAKWMLVLATVLLTAAFFAWALWLPQLRLSHAAALITNLASIAVFNALLWACITWAMYRFNAPLVRWALVEIGKPVCMKCGYILVGADKSEKCPECGEQRVQRNQHRLNEDERNHFETVQAMLQLGFDVCTGCGCLWDSKAELGKCPHCAKSLEMRAR